MGMSEFFGFLSGSSTAEMPEIYPLTLPQSEFVKIDVLNTYSKILTDTLERTEGLTEDQEQTLWDNCLKSEKSDGLVTLLAKAMTDKTDLFIVYDAVTNVVRVATSEEQQKIKTDYEKTAKSALGVFVSFREYRRSDMVKLYSALEYCTVSALYKQMNLSKATQLKIKELRKGVGSIDSSRAIAQAELMAQGLKEGKDVLMDAEDFLETAKPDLTATNQSMEFIAQKQSFYLGMPSSYMSGDQKKSGLSDTGKSDSKGIERGLRSYYFSIVKPVVFALFGKKTTFKSDDFEMLDTALNTLKAFELTSDEFITSENKLKVINKLFGFDPNTKGGPKAVDTMGAPFDQATPPGVGPASKQNGAAGGKTPPA